MKKIISLIMLSIIITISTVAFASEAVVNNAVVNNNAVDNNVVKNNVTTITGNEYDEAQKEDTKLPQTGIEDYNLVILFVVCVAGAMFAYKKVNDYRDI